MYYIVIQTNGRILFVLHYLSIFSQHILILVLYPVKTFIDGWIITAEYVSCIKGMRFCVSNKRNLKGKGIQTEFLHVLKLSTFFNGKVI